MDVKDDNFDGIIETIDEDGNVVKFELIDIVEVESKEYALLYPIGAEAVEEAEDEIVLMKLIKDEEGYLFEAIEDDDEFETVSKFIESMEDEEEA